MQALSFFNICVIYNYFWIFYVFFLQDSLYFVHKFINLVNCFLFIILFLLHFSFLQICLQLVHLLLLYFDDIHY